MEREQLDRLLAEYATGALTEEEKKQLFAAAMTDQALFDQLMEEDSLREAIELPGARNRLIDSLQPEEAALVAPVAAMAGSRSPVAAPSRSPWRLGLAWAAGLSIVFVSAAITYLLFDRPVADQLAEFRPQPPSATKPFTPPAQPATDKPAPPKVEAPPPILDRARETGAPPAVVDIPLPSAPPPPSTAASPAAPAPGAPAPSEVREEKVAVATRANRQERDQAQDELRQAQQVPAASGFTSSGSLQQGPAAPKPALAARRDAAVPAKEADAAAASSTVGRIYAPAADRAKKKEEIAPSIWRRTGDGVWTRVAADSPVSRQETIAIRYVPTGTQTVALFDDRGRRVLQKSGRAGDELELIVPRSLLERTAESTLEISIVEGSGGTGAISGVASRKSAERLPVKIVLRLE